MNKHRPVKSWKASGNTANRPTEVVYFFCAMATMLTMAATVKAMDSQRWVCRIHLFEFNGTSSEDEPEADRAHLQALLWRFNAKLFCVLGGQSLPARELHRLDADDAADGSSAQKRIQNIESNVPPRGAPRYEAAIDVVPQSQARTATKGFEFPPDTAVLEHLESVGSRHSCFQRRGAFPPR
jgi:hypothetical protein